KSIQKTLFYDHIPQIVLKKDWNVYVEPAGYGQQIIKYIAPYVYRIALSNRNIIKLKDHEVTFRYKDNENTTHTLSLDVLKFMHRFLHHVLPPHFMKVRYFGIMGANMKDKYHLLKYLLVQSLSSKIKKWFLAIRLDIKKKIRSCPYCGGRLILIGRLLRAP
ncbi:MAG: transposase, partial [bacterium]